MAVRAADQGAGRQAKQGRLPMCSASHNTTETIQSPTERMKHARVKIYRRRCGQRTSPGTPRQGAHKKERRRHEAQQGGFLVQSDESFFRKNSFWKEGGGAGGAHSPPSLKKQNIV